MPKKASIPIEELDHCAEKARQHFGRHEISAEQYEYMAKESAAEEKFYVAAAFYKLAEAAAADDDEMAMDYARRTVEMMNRMEQQS